MAIGLFYLLHNSFQTSVPNTVFQKQKETKEEGEGEQGANFLKVVLLDFK